VISEIMYHPVEEPAFQGDGTPVLNLYEDVHEFVELHNPTTNMVDLSGWELTTAIQFTFPSRASIRPGEFVVVAKDKTRLAAVAAYGLSESAFFGPYEDQLSNKGEIIRLRDANRTTVDSVTYSASFPWPISADGLGAGEDWTNLKPREYQYRGRSLERVSFVVSGNDPANWLASPLPGEPSPGRSNAVNRLRPKPVVINLDASSSATGQSLIRRNEPVRVDCLCSSVEELSKVRLEYFVDNIEQTNETRTVVEMYPLGNFTEGRFVIELPGLPDRSIVRYRIRGDRGDGDEVISPRADDPFSWHAYFVTPTRTSVNPAYDLFISAKSLRTLQTNITQNPRRYTLPDPPGLPRASWNAAEPAVFAHDGVVYDVRMRHHGSQFRRDVNRRSYKLQFPRYRLFNNRPGIFVTDKDYQTQGGHMVFRAVGLPTSSTRWVDLYMNNTARLPRLEQDEYDETMLERYHEEQFRLHPEQPLQLPGELFKAQGVFDNFGGPYGRADGKLLPARTNRNVLVWTPLQRYEWTYGLQNNGWRGHSAFKEMLEGMWKARNGRIQPPTAAEISKLRPYFAEQWDLDKTLTYLAAINWMSPWDDIIHNYFIWQQRDGKWSMLPWDFDGVMNGASHTTSIFTGLLHAGPNGFKESFIAAYRQEFRERAWWLNNTVLHPDHLVAIGLPTQIRSWTRSRLNAVNTQLALGPFERPTRPVNLTPANGGSAGPFDLLRASSYGYSTNPPLAHVSTTWTIRSAKGSYYAPVYQATTTTDLTSLPLPSYLLQLGEAYFWRCTYVADNGHPSIASSETWFTFGQPVRDASDLLLSEIMANNQNSVAHGNRHPDWIELYNPSDQPRSLDGFSLTDDFWEPAKYAFPPGVVIPSRSYLVVWCDDATAAPGLHAGFGLNAQGETICLFASSPSGPVLKDIVTIGLQLADLSVGRGGDGAGDWALNVPTPNGLNQPAQTGAVENLRINEWAANPASGSDWFEIYNPDATPLSLGGLFLTDNLANPTNSLLAPLSFIAPGGFLKLVADGNTGAGADHVGFRLNANGGSLGLYSSNRTAIDVVMYGLQMTGLSQARIPNGAATVFGGPGTPGRSNWADTDNDGLPDAWELSNGLSPFLNADAAADADGDGQSNLQEYTSGTNPRDTRSKLRIESLEWPRDDNGKVRIAFTALPGKTYTVQYRNTIADGAWLKWMDVPAQNLPRRIELTDPIGDSSQSRYYRIVTPRQP